jgi:hypothetical protein
MANHVRDFLIVYHRGVRPGEINLLSSLFLGCGGASGDTASGVGISLSGPEAGEFGENGETGESGDTGEASSPACEALIDCVREVTPEALSATIGAYGPEGNCFDTPGVTPEDCEAECGALRADLALLHPDVAECAPLGCNDGVLALDELCDSNPGCTATCTFTSSDHHCNMLNQLGCDDDEVCWVTPEGTGIGCFVAGIAMNGDTLGGSCSTSFGPCEDLSICSTHPSSCADPPCCQPTCYLGATEDDFGVCPDGSECLSLSEAFGSSLVDGAESYGFCI